MRFPGRGNSTCREVQKRVKKREAERQREADRYTVHPKWQLLVVFHKSLNQMPTKYLSSKTKVHFRYFKSLFGSMQFNRWHLYNGLRYCNNQIFFFVWFCSHLYIKWFECWRPFSPPLAYLFFPSLYQCCALYLQYWTLKHNFCFLSPPRKGTTHHGSPDCLKAPILSIPSDGCSLLAKCMLL